MTWIGVAAFFALTALASCGVVDDGGARRIDDKAVPVELLESDAPNLVPARGNSVTLCMLTDDALVPVERRLARGATRLDIVRALAVLPDPEARLGLETALASADDIDAVDVTGGTATVDVADEARQTLTADPLSTVAQIVCTLTAQPGIGLVAFTLGGAPIEVPTAEGVLTGDPLSRDDVAPLLEG